ncbi:hypothetical protein KI387_016844, partial [Taxus chinensis]
TWVRYSQTRRDHLMNICHRNQEESGLKLQERRQHSDDRLWKAKSLDCKAKTIFRFRQCDWPCRISLVLIVGFEGTS